MENKAHALAAGAFVLLLTLLLGAMAWWLTRDGGLQRVYEISSPNPVTGLNVQAAVRLKGVPVGKVTAIAFDPKVPGNVLVRISVDAGTPITRSTWATLGYQGVTGIAHIALNDDGTSQEPLTSEDGPPRIPLRPGPVGQVLDEGQRLLGQLQEAATRLNALLAPQNQQVLIRAVENAGAAAQGVQQLALGLQREVPPLARAGSESLRSLRLTLDETRQAVAQVRGAVDRLTAPGGPVEQIGRGAEALASSAQTLQAETLPQLHRSGAEAERAARAFARAATALTDNPQALVWGTAPPPPGPGEPGYPPPGAAVPPRDPKSGG